ncbi:MAG: hypothetical protein ACYS4W_05280 [Planctomycetota bacterium]
MHSENLPILYFERTFATGRRTDIMFDGHAAIIGKQNRGQWNNGEIYEAISDIICNISIAAVNRLG